LFCVCVNTGLSRKRKNSLKTSENKVLRKKYRRMTDEVTEGCRKLHNEEKHGLYSSPDIIGSWGSSVSIISDYRLAERNSIPGRGKQLFLQPLVVQTSSEAHPASHPMGTGGSFPRGKTQPGREADHSPPSSAEVKNE
jgi:hypothetical protein